MAGQQAVFQGLCEFRCGMHAFHCLPTCHNQRFPNAATYSLDHHQIISALLCQSQPLPPASPCLSAASDLILTGSSAGFCTVSAHAMVAVIVGGCGNRDNNQYDNHIAIDETAMTAAMSDVGRRRVGRASARGLFHLQAAAVSQCPRPSPGCTRPAPQLHPCPQFSNRRIHPATSLHLFEPFCRWDFSSTRHQSTATAQCLTCFQTWPTCTTSPPPPPASTRPASRPYPRLYDPSASLPSAACST